MRHLLLLLSLFLCFKTNAQTPTDSLLRVEIKTMLDSVETLYNTGKYEEARVLAEQQLERSTKSFGREDTLVETNLYHIGACYYFLGKYQEGIPYAEEALAVCGQVRGKASSVYGNHLNLLAILYTSMGQYKKALSLHLEELEHREKSLGKEHPDYGGALNNLASLYERMGQYEKALPLYLEALENCEKSLGKEHSEYGSRLNNLALLYYDMGQYDKALPLFLEALENTEKSLGKEHSVYGVRLNNLAGLYDNMGQYDKALPLYLEALENTEKSLGKEHSMYGKFLHNLAELYRTMGQYDTALQLALEALENTEKSLGKAHSQYGVCLNNLAGLYEGIGQYDKALPLYLEALENNEKSLGKAHSWYGIHLNNLALLYNRMGQYDTALPLYLESLENIEKSLGKENSSYGIRLNNLARLYEKIGQASKAAPLYSELLLNRYDQINRTFSVLSEKEKENFMATLNGHFQSARNFFAEYAAQDPSVTEQLYDMELSLKGLILHSGIAVRNAILSSGDSLSLAKYEEWQMYGKLASKEEQQPIAKRNAALAEWEAKKERLEGELSSLSEAFRESKSAGQRKWQEVQKSLAKGQAAIEFIRCKSGPDSAKTAYYAALVLRAESSRPELVKLCTEKELEAMLIAAPARPDKQVASVYGTLQNPNTALYKAVWQPLSASLKEASEVIVSPTGLLHKLSFAAMSPSAGQYLSDLVSIRQTGTTGSIIKPIKGTVTKQDHVLLAGGIKFGSDTASFQFWNELPGTLDEARGIAEQMKKGGRKVTLLSGQEATEAAFKQSAPQANIMHLATHGYFFPDPEQEKEALKALAQETGKPLAFRGDQDGWIGTSLYANWSFVNSDNPLKRSGLALANANEVWTRAMGVEGEDGVLTAQELSNVDLRKVKLVVLSACETGLGDIKGSEGVFGLQRGLKQSGAGYIIMSLWKVPDKETSEFMQMLYTNLDKGQEIRTAFTTTRKAMQKKYDPYYWAAFVLVE